MDTSKLIAELNDQHNSGKLDVLVWIDHDLHEFSVDSDVGGQIHLNVEIEEPEAPKEQTELEVVTTGSKGVVKRVKFKSDLTEEQIMALFNIESKLDTYVDSDGLVEFHNKESIIYSNIKDAKHLKQEGSDFVVK